MAEAGSFIQNPGLPGPFGALMDEYSRAAEDFCRVLEAVPEDRFLQEVSSDDPDTTSIRAIAVHAIRAARGYSNAIREARGRERDPKGTFDPAWITGPKTVRKHLRDALCHTEDSLEGLYDADDKMIYALSFKVSWGPTYDPEMIVEHGIVHLLRHRRQIERWKP